MHSGIFTMKFWNNLLKFKKQNVFFWKTSPTIDRLFLLLLLFWAMSTATNKEATRQNETRNKTDRSERREKVFRRISTWTRWSDKVEKTGGKMLRKEGKKMKKAETTIQMKKPVRADCSLGLFPSDTHTHGHSRHFFRRWFFLVQLNLIMFFVVVCNLSPHSVWLSCVAFWDYVCVWVLFRR